MRFGSRFDGRFHFHGRCGAVYSKAATRFRVWAPTAEAVTLNLYSRGLGGEADERIEMRRGARGTWGVSLRGDLHGVFYTFSATIRGAGQAEAVDPYAVAAGANGLRGMVVDLSRTNPAGWGRDRRPAFRRAVDAIVYELHVRDFTIHPSSGVEHPGKFAGLTEGRALDHLVGLGVTHVHLLPVFDFVSVDETRPEAPQYNWGYDPQNYNVPEGSYSTDPFDGVTRIREFKRMVLALHRAGIRVVMDVVYNHTARAQDSHLNLLVPGYYYRQDAKGGFSNGSGCGNETASERAMVRRLIVDSVVHWAREYHVDGFRFDLMGLHDVDTMNAVRAALDRVDRSILLYGEGWTGGESPLPEKRRASKQNAAKLDRIAAFSDDLRDGVKGAVWDGTRPGFINGRDGLEETIKFSVVAATPHPQVDCARVDYSKAPWAAEPHHCVNYVSCHDNHTLWDKLGLARRPADLPGRDPADAGRSARAAMSQRERIRLLKLANAIVLTSQGIAFLHAGEEFCRTKHGEENSYNLGDRINAIDWRRKERFRDVAGYCRGLVALRRARPELRLASARAIRRRLDFLPMPAANMVGFSIGRAGSRAPAVVVIYNARREPVVVAIPGGTWSVLADERKAGATPIRSFTGDRVAVAAQSALVLAA